MSLAVVYSRAQDGIAAPLVTCEVHLSGGLPWHLDRRTAGNGGQGSAGSRACGHPQCQLDYPQRQITVGLAPADLPKDGGRFDLPIAIGILAANGGIPRDALAQARIPWRTGPVRRIARRSTVCCQPFCTRHARPSRRCSVRERRRSGLGQRRRCAQCAEFARSLRASVWTLEFAIGRSGPQLAAIATICARISPMCAASSTLGARWRSPPPAPITCFWSGRLAPARPCWPVDCRDPAAADRNMKRWNLPQCARWPGSRWTMNSWKTRAFRSPHHTASAVALVGGGSVPRPGEDLAGASWRAVSR